MDWSWTCIVYSKLSSCMQTVAAGLKNKTIILKKLSINLYRKLHGSRSNNEKSHACLAKCL